MAKYTHQPGKPFTIVTSSESNLALTNQGEASTRFRRFHSFHISATTKKSGLGLAPGFHAASDDSQLFRIGISPIGSTVP